MKDNGIFEAYQSGFRAHHSKETALVKVVNDIRINLDKKKTSVLVLLDLSSAFDTVDDAILLNRLQNRAGLSGTVLNWFRSYLTDRDSFISIDDSASRRYKLMYGVPQGSILGPILFNLYILPLGDIIRRHSIKLESNDSEDHERPKS